jgi:hypothetical protein
MADISGAFEVDGLVKQKEALESLMMSNPEMEKRVQKLIRQVLLAARRMVSNDAKGVMKSDPRQAYKAVKSAVYKRILGGSVSILNKRNAKGGGTYDPPRRGTKDPFGRGGNRVPRSQRTQQVMSYEGADRAFILRFLNAGTDNREAGTRGGRMSGNRGRIAPRNFFANSSHKAMQQAADQLNTLIDELIKQEMK